MIGIGAVRTEHVLEHAHDAQEAGAAAVMLAPVSYQALTEDEVFGLYEDVTAELSVPLCVYDNPGTTHFTFTDELHARVAALPQVGAIKLPGPGAAERVAGLRPLVPATVAIGVSGDQFAAGALDAGADVWFSVIGGLFPRAALAIVDRARAGVGAAGAAVGAVPPPRRHPRGRAPRRRCSAWRASTTCRARCGSSTARRAPSWRRCSRLARS